MRTLRSRGEIGGLSLWSREESFHFCDIKCGKVLAHALSDGTGPFLNPPLFIPSPSPFHAGDHKICGCLAKLNAERIYGTVEGFFSRTFVDGS